jgi:leucyl aminopeptidase
MNIKTTATSLLEWRGDALAIGFWEDNVSITGDLLTLNTQLQGIVQEIIDEAEFKGAAASTVVTRVASGANIKKLMLVGLGKNTAPQADQYRRAAAAIARAAKKEKCETLAISLPVGDISTDIVTQVVSEGLLLALHEDKRFKSEKSEEKKAPPKNLNEVHLLGLGEQPAAILRAQAIAAGVWRKPLRLLLASMGWS